MPNIPPVIAIAKQAGEVALAMQKDVVRESKKDGEVTTRADRSSDEILRRGLEKFGFPVFSEDSTNDVIKSDAHWIIDPLDGTLPFLDHSPEWTVMVGFVQGNQPTLGVVYAPAQKKLWYADASGAFCEVGGVRNPIHVSMKTDPSDAVMLTSIFHHSPEMDSLAHNLNATQKPMHGMGAKVCAVAEGAAEMVWSAGSIGQWDVCGPHAILIAAGGMLTDGKGNEIQYSGTDRVSGVAASNGLLHAALVGAARETSTER